ncbi:protein of unknown function [Taphrina deformans PYCC 5710]|uniref:Lipase 1 n=1 Tax=Taphrina deformans (strain PYCC 5710 / ATCC 11124 / CBS 356.35 / IMI 108563 / JCM 9778 / NBRC 8474) TaxID=1097556 RepID=R4XHD7_TAPDE|nr:protein of unknown function [Taphrina deformans PYCC 5710]|eukprot:CCG83943.1 protein of unknown function [Taphrina deformans PYCC 5710]
MRFTLLAVLTGIALVWGQTILPPSIDPFNVPPVGYETAAPGSILRVRVAPGNLSSLFNASAAYHILYRTTDSQYRPTSAVTTLFVPRLANGSKLLSYQIPYDSANVDAGPSYALYGGNQADIRAGLGRGWYVTSPDYEGPLASYTAGVLSGHATLDGVRAVLAAGFGLGPDATYAMAGYSGGALASEWAAELQQAYAPELSFAGAALGGLTPNVTSVMAALDGTLTAGIIVSAIIGLATQYPGYLDVLTSQLKTTGPYNATTFFSARNLSLVGTIVTFANQNITDYFVDGAADLASTMAVAVINRDGIMGYHGVPQMPVFAYKAIGDELSPVVDTDRLIARYCGIGANIVYNRNTVGMHATEMANGDSRTFRFISDVLNGGYSHTGCTILNVTNSGNSSVYLP